MTNYFSKPDSLVNAVRSVMSGKKEEQLDEAKKLDTVDPKQLKGDYDDREDKDIDNDGDTDSSDEFLHKRRKAIAKAVKEAMCGKKMKNEEDDEEDDDDEDESDDDEDESDDEDEDDEDDEEDEDVKESSEEKKMKGKGKKDKLETEPEMDPVRMVPEGLVSESIARSAGMKDALESFRKSKAYWNKSSVLAKGIVKEYGREYEKDFVQIEKLLNKVGEYIDQMKSELLGENVVAEETDGEKNQFGAKTTKHKLKMKFKKGSTKPAFEEVDTEKREKIVKGMKDKMSGFKKRYGDRAKDVMYATATKLAMKEGIELTEEDLQELSKNTLGNYVKKAVSSVDKESGRQGVKIGLGRKGDDVDKHDKRITNRMVGVDRAVKKLTREEAAIEEARRGRPPKVAVDGDEAEDTNIIMQLRKVVSLRGQKPVVFDNGKKTSVDMRDAQKALSMFTNARKPDDKEDLMKKFSSSPESFDAAVK